MYPEDLVGPMRQELVALGFVEIRTSSDVERELNDRSGTALVWRLILCVGVRPVTFAQV